MQNDSVPKLYHGTSESAVKRILKEGLLPRSVSGVGGNWDHTVPSASDRTYLTKGYAPYFAAMAAEEGERWAIIEIDYTRLAMAQYDSTYFLPDEDYVEQILRAQTITSLETQRDEMKRKAEQVLRTSSYLTGPRMGEQKDLADREHYELYRSINMIDSVLEEFPFDAECYERTAWIRDNILLFQHMAISSLDGMGNISFNGHIPLRCITRISLFDPKSNPHMAMAAMDPTISTMNWRICSEKYMEITRWFLGYDVDSRKVRNDYGWQDHLKAELATKTHELNTLISNEEDCTEQIEELKKKIEETAKNLAAYEEDPYEEILRDTGGIEVVEVSQHGQGVEVRLKSKDEMINKLMKSFESSVQHITEFSPQAVGGDHLAKKNSFLQHYRREIEASWDKK